jgi:CubicO group peptidase (beta-lactamase class C family)
VDALSDARLARGRALLEAAVAQGENPGSVAVIARREKLHVEVVGRRSFEEEDPMTRDSIFRISSMTKPVVAAAAMTLVEECKLRLDDPVDAWLPELAHPRVLRDPTSPLEASEPAQQPITLRHLLTCTFGLGVLLLPPEASPIAGALGAPELGQGPPDPTKLVAPDEWMRRMGELPLVRPPGAAWIYSTGLDVLGVLLTRVSGQPLETFLDARIFRPLEMKDTGFSVPANKLDRLVTAYATDHVTGKRRIYDLPRSGGWSRPPAFPSGAAGLVSTADDYLAFARMFAHYGKHGSDRILSRPSVEAMTSDQLTDAQKANALWLPGFFATRGWGFGMMVATHRSDLGGSVGSYGWDGGLGTIWRNDPREELTVLLLTQRGWSSPELPTVARDLLTTAYQAIDV